MDPVSLPVVTPSFEVVGSMVAYIYTYIYIYISHENPEWQISRGGYPFGSSLIAREFGDKDIKIMSFMMLRLVVPAWIAV